MYQLIYLSSAKERFSSSDLTELLTAAREKNLRNHITGMLLYFDGNFLQLMEGEEKDVMDLFSSIENDPRHTGIITLEQGAVDKRLFSDWNMGFKETSMKEINQLPGYADVTAKDFLQNITNNEDNYGLAILQNFQKNMTGQIV